MKLKRSIFLWVTGLLAVVILTTGAVTCVFILKSHRTASESIFRTQLAFLARQAEPLVLWDDRVALKSLLHDFVCNACEVVPDNRTALNSLFRGFIHQGSDVAAYAFIERDGQPYVYTFDVGVPKALLLGLAVRGSGDQPVTREGVDAQGRHLRDIALPVGDGQAVVHLGVLPTVIDRHALARVLTVAAFSVLALVAGTALAAVVTRLITREEDRMTAALAAEVSERQQAEQELKKYATELERANAVLQETTADAFVSRTKAEQAAEMLRATQQELMNASRQAGMAEVASGVLHNVGNVLNSVTVSATLARDKLTQSKVANLKRAMDVAREHADDLGHFVTAHPQGKHLIGYLTELSQYLSREQSSVLTELEGLAKNIEHVKQIINTQQSYANSSGVMETVSLPDLLDDAMRMSVSSVERGRIEMVVECADLPSVTIDKHTVLQILVNLLRNATYAVKATDRPDKRVTLRSAMSSDTRMRLEVIDNGIGIPRENLTRIFAHGFTTKKDGHGFGLHAGANAARRLGGSLAVHSDGPNTGATFTLELPVSPTRDGVRPTTTQKTDQSRQPTTAT